MADVYGDAAKLGKPIGQDVALGRPSATFDVRGDAERSLRTMAHEVRAAVWEEARELRVFLDLVVAHVVERALATQS